ncbi:MAG: peptidoglycan-binding protein [Geminicoccaceae bacterium]
MSTHLRIGCRGDDVRDLQRRLARQGYAPGPIDGHFGTSTRQAIMRFQQDADLLADGIVGPRTSRALRLKPAEPAFDLDTVVTDLVAPLFPFTPVPPIARNLPHVRAGLAEFGLSDAPMLLMALSTIRAECENFEPQEERPSRYSCSPGCDDFDLYDERIDLGNRGTPDGRRFRGRGFVQLTGRANYLRIGRLIGLGDRLEQTPGLASEPETAGRILAAFLSTRERAIKEALLEDDLARARRLVNGGAHGLGRFVDCYRRGLRALAIECNDPPADVRPFLAAE